MLYVSRNDEYTGKAEIYRVARTLATYNDIYNELHSMGIPRNRVVLIEEVDTPEYDAEVDARHSDHKERYRLENEFDSEREAAYEKMVQTSRYDRKLASEAAMRSASLLDEAKLQHAAQLGEYKVAMAAQSDQHSKTVLDLTNQVASMQALLNEKLAEIQGTNVDTDGDAEMAAALANGDAEVAAALTAPDGDEAFAEALDAEYGAEDRAVTELSAKAAAVSINEDTTWQQVTDKKSKSHTPTANETAGSDGLGDPPPRKQTALYGNVGSSSESTGSYCKR